MTEFGVLTRVDPRDVWRKEATDFTPWLASNLQALGMAVGIDLEFLQQEASVGAFSLDILARDHRGRLVVIENQLEVTDHDHLGKLLTYAAGHDAGAVIWIAREIREEHRQALDWLNQHTNENLDFFGVVVEVWKIDDSRPAYTFKPVALPNEWRKEVASGAARSPRAEAYRAFFQRLIDELRERYRFTGVRTAQPQSWYTFSSGHSGIAYGVSFAQGGKVRADVYIDRGEVRQNKELFNRLSNDKRQIEAEFGGALTWERLDERRACRIAVYRPGRIDEAVTLDEILRWAIEQLLKLKKVFGPRLSEVLPQLSAEES